MSLTRDELERRLEYTYGDKVNGDETAWEREELLQTALAAMDERDEAIQRGVSSAVALGKCQGERDALAAEGRLLREALEPAHRWLMRLVQSDNGRWVLNQRPDDADLAAMLAALSTPAPLITAEVARVRRLEAVLEAAEAQDPPASANLARAIRAYQEGERPGGEV